MTAMTKSPIVNVIRKNAEAKGLTPSALAAETGMSYSRAHDMLNTSDGDHLRNVEAALKFLAPDLWKRILSAASRK